ncbi:MAG TPA: ribonuclease PH, partial [Paracoccaceae bacterium]|nr:ribonuclease PH [Paracoccaceae bacterium]
NQEAGADAGVGAALLALARLRAAGTITADPVLRDVAAVSCGIYAGVPVLDLDYAEDSEAGVDGNFVMTAEGALVEIQMTAEGAVFSRPEMEAKLALAETGVRALAAAQSLSLVAR